jgi:hypothetical protein
MKVRRPIPVSDGYLERRFLDLEGSTYSIAALNRNNELGDARWLWPLSSSGRVAEAVRIHRMNGVVLKK